MKKISTFTIVKNEIEYIGYNIMSMLPYVDEMVFADGNSTDGTLELIKYIQNKYDTHKKIKLFENRDCKDLKQDYIGLFNWTLYQCTSDYVWFLHPDMICINPSLIRDSIKDGLRYSVKMVSFAGDRKHVFSKGRDDRWATIYANRLGLHFAGYYGAKEEDFYFENLTGDEHTFYKDVSYLPYDIIDTDIQLYHYCDTKPIERRRDRLSKIVKINFPDYKKSEIEEAVNKHPRVTIKTSELDYGRKFEISETKLEEPEVFKTYAKEFESFRQTK